MRSRKKCLCAAGVRAANPRRPKSPPRPRRATWRTSNRPTLKMSRGANPSRKSSRPYVLRSGLPASTKIRSEICGVSSKDRKSHRNRKSEAWPLASRFSDRVASNCKGRERPGARPAARGTLSRKSYHIEFDKKESRTGFPSGSCSTEGITVLDYCCATTSSDAFPSVSWFTDVTTPCRLKDGSDAASIRVAAKVPSL